MNVRAVVPVLASAVIALVLTKPLVTPAAPLPVAPVDLSGVWMPTAIGPDGNRHRTWPANPPFVPAVQAAYDSYRKHMDADEPDYDDARSCLPYIMPHPMLVVAQYPLEIVQTPGRVTMIFELHNDVRRIYLDGRAPPSGLRPTWMGYSVGHWEGDALVVRTASIRDGEPTYPHGPRLVVTERLRLIQDKDGKTMLEDELTIDDPDTYSAPFKVSNYFRQRPGVEVGEYFCSEDLWQQNLSGDGGKIPWRN
jgi:hypothetical protein